MMPERKGRSGKKPKYQIADIGGADLTAQDISTERVLNFLIKGEINSADQPASTSGMDRDEPVVTISAPQTTPPPLPESRASTSLPSTESRSKKSLAHLFERASGS